MKKWCAALVALLVGFFLLFGTPSAQKNEVVGAGKSSVPTGKTLDIWFVNLGEKAFLDQVFFKPHSSSDWGKNLLPEDMDGAFEGQRFVVHLDAYHGCDNWDFSITGDFSGHAMEAFDQKIDFDDGFNLCGLKAVGIATVKKELRVVGMKADGKPFLIKANGN